MSNPPQTQPVSIVAIPAEQVTKPSDFFICKPFNGCKLLASACLTRQKDAATGAGVGANGTKFSKDYLKPCVTCADGKRIAKVCAGKGASSNETLDAATAALPIDPRAKARKPRKQETTLEQQQESRIRGARASARSKSSRKSAERLDAATDEDDAPEKLVFVRVVHESVEADPLAGVASSGISTPETERAFFEVMAQDAKHLPDVEEPLPWGAPVEDRRTMPAMFEVPPSSRRSVVDIAMFEAWIESVHVSLAEIERRLDRRMRDLTLQVLESIDRLRVVLEVQRGPVTEAEALDEVFQRKLGANRNLIDKHIYGILGDTPKQFVALMEETGLSRDRLKAALARLKDAGLGKHIKTGSDTGWVRTEGT